MTKAEIISAIVENTGNDKQTVQETVENFLEVVKSAMTDGNNVYFRGFGSFTLQHRKKKIARNIKKNTLIEVDAHFYPKFKPSKEFVAQVKKSVPLPQ
jgi:DNA-binding protein HU-beta